MKNTIAGFQKLSVKIAPLFQPYSTRALGEDVELCLCVLMFFASGTSAFSMFYILLVVIPFKMWHIANRGSASILGISIECQ